jgi:hypothetical protein
VAENGAFGGAVFGILFHQTAPARLAALTSFRLSCQASKVLSHRSTWVSEEELIAVYELIKEYNDVRVKEVAHGLQRTRQS